MPAPKTLAMHAQDGTYRADRHGDRMEPSFAPGKPKRTSRVPKDARWIWELVTSHYPKDGQSPLDAVTLESLCRWWSRWNAFDKRLQDAEGAEDEYKVAMLAVASWKQVEKLAMRFGMSGLDRARLKMPPAQQAAETDPLERLKGLGAKAS